MMNTFDQTIERMAIEIEQAEGASILIGVTDDTILRDHAVDALRKRLAADISLDDFRYDVTHLSILEGAMTAVSSQAGRPAISVTGLEALPRDKRTEAIKLLNVDRGRLGHTGIAVILWVNRATLTEISNWSPDFYSWRSVTLFVEPPPGWNVLESMRRSYLRALVTHHEYVNLQGLAPTRGGQIVQMRMEEIFIPLRAEQEVKSSDVPLPLSLTAVGSAANQGAAAGHGTITAVGGLTGVGSIASVEGNENGEWFEDMPAEMRRVQPSSGFAAHREVRFRHVEIPELLRERRAVVLGDPGAGKTTLLRYVAYTLAKSQLSTSQPEFLHRVPDLSDCLPVYVRMGEYAHHLQQHPEAELDAFAPSGCQAHQLPLFDELLQDAMVHGRVLFLLDSLDEVVDSEQRREVGQRIEKFARAHTQCRILVTSRIVGYREAQLGGEFSQFTISPFEEDEVRRFAQNWYAALGMAGGAEELLKAIQANPSVRRLASNPLLLTVIALIHWRGTKLPSHRVTLYRLAAETLVDQWMSYRRVTPEGWDVQETLQVLLPAIAWHLHSTTSSGLVGQQELHDLLVNTLRQHDRRLSAKEAHARASLFRRNVSEFSGIFLERGLDQSGRGIYGFLHLTFEEYFAALRLADKWQQEGERVLKPLLHDPRWTETILLTAGHCAEFGQYQATQFVRSILEARSQYEDILHRDLLMAARCLADDVRMDVDLRRTILSQLLRLYFHSKSPRSLREDIRDTFARLSGTGMQKDLVKELTKRLTTNKSDVRMRSAKAIEGLGAAAATSEVIALLLKSLTDADQNVRGAAAWALGHLGSAAASPAVATALLKRVNDTDGNVRGFAAGALGLLGTAASTPEALVALCKCLTDADWNVREIAAWGLKRLGSATMTPEALAAIPKYFTGIDRNTAVASLGALGIFGPPSEVRATLIKCLTARDTGVRAAAAWALGQLGPVAATPEVVTALFNRLYDPDRRVSEKAAWALRQMDTTAAQPRELDFILKYLTDPQPNVRGVLAWIVGQLGPAIATPEVVVALLRVLNDPDWSVRVITTIALGQLGSVAATPEVVTALLNSLAARDTGVRAAAVWALGQLGPVAATPEVVTALLNRIEDDDETVPPLAGEALGKEGVIAATPEGGAALLGRLTGVDDSVRGLAELTLGRLGSVAATPEVVTALLNHITDADPGVRGAAAAAIENLSRYVSAPERPEAVKLLLTLTRNRNEESRQALYVGLRNLLAAEGA